MQQDRDLSEESEVLTSSAKFKRAQKKSAIKMNNMLMQSFLKTKICHAESYWSLRQKEKSIFPGPAAEFGLFINQTSCARHCSGSWEHRREQNKKLFVFCWMQTTNKTISMGEKTKLITLHLLLHPDLASGTLATGRAHLV